VILTDLPALTLTTPGIEVSLLDTRQATDIVAVAEQFLVGEELEQLAAISNAGRRREWVAARICVKLMAMRNGLIVDAHDCRISKNASGRPYLVKATGEPLAGVGDCSLSHKDRFACACLCRSASIRVGVDVEKISPRLRKIRNAFMSPFDVRGLADSAEADFAVLWTLKEAYAKAVGVGMQVGLGNLICDGDARTGAPCVRSPTGECAHARYLVYKGYAVGVCFQDSSLLPSMGD